jgi:hypothetical protein
MEFVKELFEEKFTEDARSAVLSFDFLLYHVDFLAPNYRFFVQISLVRHVCWSSSGTRID